MSSLDYFVSSRRTGYLSKLKWDKETVWFPMNWTIDGFIGRKLSSSPCLFIAQGCVSQKHRSLKLIVAHW